MEVAQVLTCVFLFPSIFFYMITADVSGIAFLIILVYTYAIFFDSLVGYLLLPISYNRWRYCPTFNYLERNHHQRENTNNDAIRQDRVQRYAINEENDIQINESNHPVLDEIRMENNDDLFPSAEIVQNPEYSKSDDKDEAIDIKELEEMSCSI